MHKYKKLNLMLGSPPLGETSCLQFPKYPTGLSVSFEASNHPQGNAKDRECGIPKKLHMIVSILRTTAESWRLEKREWDSSFLHIPWECPDSLVSFEEIIHPQCAGILGNHIFSMIPADSCVDPLQPAR